MRHWVLFGCLAFVVSLAPACAQAAEGDFALFNYLTGNPPPAMVTYTPSELDPRNPANQAALRTSSIRADLEALRGAFDGLVLYGYHEATTPRIVAVAKSLGYRAILLGIWDIKSAAEIDGVAEVVRQYEEELALGVIVGNEGITFRRYELEDLAIAADRLRRKGVEAPLTTSEPLVGYQQEAVRAFGDFLAPNIHPVFDRPNLSPSEAADWVRQEAASLARRIGKPVLVKETGVPHGDKEGFTPDAQRAFWQAYRREGDLARDPAAPRAWRFHGVAFEAFDLPWKAEESRIPFEKSWGLFSKDRQPYPALDVWRRR